MLRLVASVTNIAASVSRSRSARSSLTKGAIANRHVTATISQKKGLHTMAILSGPVWGGVGSATSRADNCSGTLPSTEIEEAAGERHEGGDEQCEFDDRDPADRHERRADAFQQPECQPAEQRTCRIA